MAKAKKPTEKQGTRPRKGMRVKDLPARGSLAQKIKGGAVDAFIYFEEPKPVVPVVKK